MSFFTANISENSKHTGIVALKEIKFKVLSAKVAAQIHFWLRNAKVTTI